MEMVKPKYPVGERVQLIGNRMAHFDATEVLFTPDLDFLVLKVEDGFEYLYHLELDISGLKFQIYVGEDSLRPKEPHRSPKLTAGGNDPATHVSIAQVRKHLFTLSEDDRTEWLANLGFCRDCGVNTGGSVCHCMNDI